MVFAIIELPHFSITGSFSLNPPSVPSFEINWYAKGGLFNQPSLIGVGEAGAEAVLPLTNTAAMKDIADAISIPIIDNFNAKIAGMPRYAVAESPTSNRLLGYYPNFAYGNVQSNNSVYAAERSYRDSQSSAETNTLLRELIDTVREGIRDGRNITIDGRTLVEVYDERKARNGWEFAGP